MIYDFDTYQEADQSGNYDVCICGAGAAGITLAWFLSSKGKKVALLEGGGRRYSQQSQDIYKGNSIGQPYYLDVFRLRYFGGTTNHWTGRCWPFEKADFRERIDNGLPGWPITFDEIEKYLVQSKKILGLPTEDTFKALPGSEIDSEIFEPDEFYYSNPVRFGEKYYEYLANAPNVDVFLNANVISISLGVDLQTVEKVEIRSFNSKQESIKASNFILSMGAIENARLLLYSNFQITSGIGNQTDMVGRCFMEHLSIELGEFIAEPAKWGDNGQMVFFTRPEHVVKSNTSMSAISFTIVKSPRVYGRTAELKKLLIRLSCWTGMSDQLQFIEKHWCIGEGRIATLCEQLPNKESRVTLTDEIDQIGLKKVSLDWKISERDKESIRYMATQMAIEFAKNNLGRVKLFPYILDPGIDIPGYGAHSHHMGTTRMAAEHKDGVVDSNCMVFGTTNLYIAGSSVFSTGGGGNPTMPIIQLALRLGEHLIHR
jgi:choline dehydrogenase-like flavoprotein